MSLVLVILAFAAPLGAIILYHGVGLAPHVAVLIAGSDAVQWQMLIFWLMALVALFPIALVIASVRPEPNEKPAGISLILLFVLLTGSDLFAMWLAAHVGLPDVALRDAKYWTELVVFLYAAAAVFLFINEPMAQWERRILGRLRGR